MMRCDAVAVWSVYGSDFPYRPGARAVRHLAFCTACTDSAAAHVHAISRQRNLRRRRNSWMDRDAWPDAAELCVQVDDSPEQRGGPEGRQAESVQRKGHD